MEITFFVGATATKLIDGKPDKNPTKFFGGETADIVDKEAKILVPEFAALADSEEAKKFLRGHIVNPRTRRQRLDAETPGLKEKLAHKRALARLVEDSADKMGEQVKEVRRSRRTGS